MTDGRSRVYCKKMTVSTRDIFSGLEFSTAPRDFNTGPINFHLLLRTENTDRAITGGTHLRPLHLDSPHS